MSTTPRFKPATPGDAAEFDTIMAHNPNTLARFWELYAEFWQRGAVSPELKEMTRMRNARVTDCGL